MRLTTITLSKGKEKFFLVTIVSNGTTFRFKYKKGVSQMNKKQLDETRIYIEKNWRQLYQSKVEERKPKIKSYIDLLYEALETQKPLIAPKTYINYKWAVKAFEKFSKEYPNINIKNLTQKDYSLFLNFLQVSNNSKRHYSVVLKCLFAVLKRDKVISENPFENKRFPTVEQASILPIPENDRILILDTIKNNNEDLYTLVLLIYYGFIRVNEAVQLRVEHIKLDTNLIHIPSNISKTNRYRNVYIVSPLKDHLGSLKLNERKPSEPLLSFKGLEHARDLYEACIKKHKVPYHSPYRFKHSGVCEAYRRGMGIIEIKNQCGHTKIETTYRYLAGLGLTDNLRFDVWS